MLLSRPIGGQKKTFEELLEEQLRLEEQRLKSVRQAEVREYDKRILYSRIFFLFCEFLEMVNYKLGLNYTGQH